MFERLKQMLIKEFIQVFRDKRSRFILFGPPIVQMLIFGYAATFEIHHVPTVVLDQDHSQESRDLVSRFASSPYFSVDRQLTDYREIGDALWHRFNKDAGKAGTVGYYRGLVTAYRATGHHPRLVRELDAVVTQIEKETGHPGVWPLPD